VGESKIIYSVLGGSNAAREQPQARVLRRRPWHHSDFSATVSASISLIVRTNGKRRW